MFKGLESVLFVFGGFIDRASGVVAVLQGEYRPAAFTPRVSSAARIL